MTVEVLLEKLDGVKQVAHGRWRARCPAHDGKNPSALSIGETSDGVTLIKCFAGCNVSDVVQAVGLELHDLFPRIEWQTTGVYGSRPRRPRVDWPVLIAACERDLILVKIVLAQIGRREPINDEDAIACQSAATRTYRLVDEACRG